MLAGQQMIAQRLQDQQGQPGYTGLQNYEQIKADCLSKKALFEDSEFPAVNASLFSADDEENQKEFKWLRPSVSTVTVAMQMQMQMHTHP